MTTVTLDPATEALATRMVEAIERGDVDAWGAAFAPDAVTWHSYSGAQMSAADNVELLRGLFAAVVAELRYESVRRSATEDGFLQQHQLVMTAHNGARFETGVCQVMHVADGLVASMEEYLDSSALQFGAQNAAAPPA